ncbi:MAG: pantetheine-phosphate adenylyltransferase [Bacteroidales bacterium]|nr:pantetheine-phosphate adenylyltransferase [Bacteroidales bacterium]
MNIAVFAGSFCPYTKGHEDILNKVMPLFDTIYIAIGHNVRKQDVFSVEERMEWISKLYANNDKIRVVTYTGLTVDLCRQVGAQYLIRGIRNSADYQMEQEMGLINEQLNAEVKTLFVPTSPKWAAVSSSMVRELWALKADYSPFISYPLPEKRP